MQFNQFEAGVLVYSINVMSFRTITILAGLSVLVAPALANDAYTNFGPGFDNTVGWVVNDPSIDPAFQFQATASGSLTSLTVAMGNYFDFSGAADSFTLNLYADPAGNPNGEGALLGSFGGMTDGTYYSALVNPIVVAASGVNIVAGDYYWLEATSTNGTAWDFNSTGAQGPVLEAGAPYSNPDTSAAFSVQVTPEPSSFAAMAGVLGLGLIAKRRRRA